MPLQSNLTSRVADALAVAGIDRKFAVITPAADTRFGDYQTNAAMVAAKSLKTNPREVAARILTHLSVEDLCEKPQVAGAGFINFKILNAALADAVNAIRVDERLGVKPAVTPQTIA